jgi:hypothetical protein
MSQISNLIVQAEQVGGAVDAAFSSLSDERLNWKRSPGEWSIAQCLEHLMLINTPYFPRIAQIIHGDHKATRWERVPLLPILFGRLVLGAVQPESTRKVRARPAFAPTSSLIDAGICRRFSAHQAELIRLMKTTAKLPIEKIIITSVVSPVVTYSLLDAYRILVAHERRHLQQAERVLQAPGFPVR